MNSSNAPGRALGTQALNELQVEAVFRSRMWNGLRDATVEATGSERWREVMMSAMNQSDGFEDHPLQHLIEEVLFILGAERECFLRQLGRRMMTSLLEEVDPLLRNSTHPEKFLAYILRRNLLENIGVLDVHLDTVVAHLSERRLYFTTVGLFQDTAVFHAAAFEALGEDLGIPLNVKLVDPGKHSVQGMPNRMSWRCTLA
jgi:hypothetical protein